MVGSVRVIGLDVVVGVIIGLGFGAVRVVMLDDEHSAQNIHGLNHQSIEKSRNVTPVMDRHTDQGWTPCLLCKPACPTPPYKTPSLSRPALPGPWKYSKALGQN